MPRETSEAAGAVERAVASNRPALELLRQRLLAAPPPFVVTCARRGSDAATLFKETCRTHAEAISGAEILHGPVAIADSTLRAIVFDGGDATRPGLLNLAERLRGTGVETLVASVDQGHAASGLRGLLSRFYLAVERVSRELGFDPDMPVGLSNVTRTI